MAVILSLETSTDVCSVALHDRNRLLASEEVHEPQSHGSQLGPMVDRVVRSAFLKLKDIRAVAISHGPGSYTGLRIGTSTAKGLCYALEIPLISVGTLELLAFQASPLNTSGSLLCPMLDARRMEVYCLISDPALNLVEPVSAKVIDQNSFSELLEHNRVLFFGNGAEKCKQVITHPNAAFLDGIFPSASALGVIAAGKFQRKEFEDLVHFQPFYLKEFVAKKSGTSI